MHPLPCGRILLAFSGGPDSVGLAAALGGAEVLLAYADHRLRGAAQARRERARVAAAAHRLRRPLVRTRLRCGAGEGGARRARYRALHALARKHGCATLATAHTADDLAETVLLQLLRGTGPRGLASLRPAARLGGLLRIRPALDERRDALRARGAGIPTVEDPTNRLLQGERARVRALLLPALGVLLGGDPVPPLCALAAGAGGMRTALERRARRLSRRAGRRRLLAEPASTFPYLVECLRRRAGRGGPPLTGRAYAALRAFLAAGRRGRVYPSPGGERWHLDGGDRVRVLAPPADGF